MDRRLLLTIAICVAIMFGYSLIMKRFSPPPPPAPAGDTVAAPSGNPPGAPPAAAPAEGVPKPAEAGKPGETSKLAEAGKPTEGGKPGELAEAPKRPDEQRVTHEEPGLYRTELTSYGAAPTSFVLLNP